MLACASSLGLRTQGAHPSQGPGQLKTGFLREAVRLILLAALIDRVLTRVAILVSVPPQSPTHGIRAAALGVLARSID